MERERGDEIPYGEPMPRAVMDDNPYRRTSPGPKSRFTAAEIAQIRDVYDRWNAIRRERIRITKQLNLGHSGFNRIGQGRLGKNPRD